MAASPLTASERLLAIVLPAAHLPLDPARRSNTEELPALILPWGDSGYALSSALERLASGFDTDVLTIARAAMRVLLFRYSGSLNESDAAEPGWREFVRREVEGTTGSFDPARARYQIIVRREPSEAPAADLELVVTGTGNRLAGLWKARAGLCTRGELQRMAGHFLRLVQGFVREPEASAWGPDLLSEVEWQQALDDWNRTTATYPRDHSIAALFADVAAGNADRIAVQDGDFRLTYRELDLQSNRLARLLTAAGADAGERVAIALPRSAAMVVAMLAVLKVGATYVPVDLSYPAERVEFMLRDTGVCLLIAGTEEQLPASRDCRTVTVDTRLAALRGWNEDPIAGVDGGSENCAYIMYTSGSTGKPKGVAVPQRAVVRLVRNTGYVNFDSNEIFAQIANASFDAITFEVWGALLNGARLAIIPSQQVLSAQAFAAALSDQGVTAMFLTSSLFNVLAREIPETLGRVRQLLVGGDAVDPRWARHVLKTSEAGRIINGYGPTESTTFAVTHDITEVAENAASVPIGRPIANTRAYVLDQRLRPVPVGVTGELYLAGDGLATGYWNRPELTAERFLWHTFPGRPAERLYRTGDLARYREDGLIEHLGRIDQQVKVRGFRIELGEIAAALREHPAVADSLALVQEDEKHGRSILAYVATAARPLPSGQEFRAFLSARLPAYAVPSFVVVLERFPLSPNGKVRREALPLPAPAASRDRFRPATGAEEKVADAWRQVLGLEQLDADANFFDLGGNSILTVSLEAELKRRFKDALTTVDLFRYSTIRTQAAVLAGERQTPAVSANETQLRAAKRAEALARIVKPKGAKTV